MYALILYAVFLLACSQEPQDHKTSVYKYSDTPYHWGVILNRDPVHNLNNTFQHGDLCVVLKDKYLVSIVNRQIVQVQWMPDAAGTLCPNDAVVMLDMDQYP